MSRKRLEEIDNSFKEFKEYSKKAKDNLIHSGKLVYEDVLDQAKESYSLGVKHMLKDYIASTSGSMIFSFPFIAAVQTIVPKVLPFLSDMAVSSEEEAMQFIFMVTLSGGGYVISKIRKGSRYAFRFDEEHNPDFKKKINKHDGILNSAINFPLNLGMYLLNPELTISEALSQTFGRSVGNYVSGALDGNGVDLMEDLMGLHKSKRMPKYIQNMNKRIKYGVAVGLMLSSYGTTQGIYSIADSIYPNQINQEKESSLEKKISNEFVEFSPKKANEFLYPKDIKEELNN